MHTPASLAPFPFLFGGTFIEGTRNKSLTNKKKTFPFLFGGTFIEGSRGGVIPSK